MDYSSITTSGSVSDFWTTTWNNISNALNGWWHYLGAVIAGLVILAIGVIIAALVRYLIVWVLDWLRLGRMLRQLGVDKYVNVRYNWTPLLGDLAWWFVVLTFFLAAMEVVGLSSYYVVDRFLGYVPTAFLGATVVFVGFVFASLLSRVAMAVADWLNIHSAGVVGGAVRGAIYVLTAIFALSVFGVDAQWIQDMILGAIAASALAAAIALGLGGGWKGPESAAGGLLKRWGDLWPKK